MMNALSGPEPQDVGSPLSPQVWLACVLTPPYGFTITELWWIGFARLSDEKHQAQFTIPKKEPGS
jgi:hypothetical protein